MGNAGRCPECNSIIYRDVITESYTLAIEWRVLVQVVKGEGEDRVTVPDERGVQQCRMLGATSPRIRWSMGGFVNPQMWSICGAPLT